MQVMTTEHPRWDEFCERLEGPEGCDFKEVDGKVGWKCKGGRNRDFAIGILDKMGEIDIPSSLAYFDTRGGHCDCEILFNVGDG